MKATTKSDLFYHGSSFTIGNREYGTYMCVGQRGRGKTTYWLNEAFNRAVKEQIKFSGENVQYKHKFIFVRREEKQMKLVLANGLLTSPATVWKSRWAGWADYYNDHHIHLRDKSGKSYHVGYYYDLNTVKGIMVEDADLLIFDEIVEPVRSKYKGGDGGSSEPEMFARLDETIFRRRDNWFILLGNDDCPTDPYREYFHVPYGATTFRDKERGFFYEFDTSEATTEDKLKTSTGRRWKNTRYSSYSNGAIALGEVSEDLIAPRPSHTKIVANIKMNGVLLTVWEDDSALITYVTDECKLNNTAPIYSVTTTDMSINTDFINYCSGAMQIFKVKYGSGRMRFNSQRTASLFLTILGLIM